VADAFCASRLGASPSPGGVFGMLPSTPLSREIVERAWPADIVPP